MQQQKIWLVQEPTNLGLNFLYFKAIDVADVELKYSEGNYSDAGDFLGYDCDGQYIEFEHFNFKPEKTAWIKNGKVFKHMDSPPLPGEEIEKEVLLESWWVAIPPADMESKSQNFLIMAKDSEECERKYVEKNYIELGDFVDEEYYGSSGFQMIFTKKTISDPDNQVTIINNKIVSGKKLLP